MMNHLTSAARAPDGSSLIWARRPHDPAQDDDDQGGKESRERGQEASHHIAKGSRNRL